PRFGQSPVAVNGFDRDVERLGRLFHAQPAEEAQLHHLTFACVHYGQRAERLIERQQTFIPLWTHHHHFNERNLVSRAAALPAATVTREVYERVAHQARGGGKKESAVFQRRLIGVNQPQIGFVDERSGLQSMASAFTTHVVFRQPAQFVVNERHQFV